MASTASGPVPDLTPVVLVVLDDFGRSVFEVGATLADPGGAFDLSVDDDIVATSRLGVVAQTEPNVEFVALLDDPANVVIDPVSTGLVDAITGVTGTGPTVSLGSRTLEDFSPAEVTALTAAARTALQTAGTDLSDDGAVVEVIRTELGRAIADAAGGIIEAFVGVTRPVSSLGASTTFSLSSGKRAYRFDEDLAMNDLFDGDACSRCFHVEVNGTPFASMQANRTREALEEYVFGPEPAGPLLVTRKAFMSRAGGVFVRYTDVIENPTANPVNATHELLTDWASGNGSILATSSGDTTITTADEWFVIGRDGVSAEIVAVWCGLADINDTNVVDSVITRSAMPVPAGGQVSVITFIGTFPITTPLVDVTDALEGLTTEPYLPNLLPLDHATNVTFTIANPLFDVEVRGEAGSVGPFTALTVFNTVTTETILLDARRDGSFDAELLGGPGDPITIDGADGTMDTKVLP